MQNMFKECLKFQLFWQTESRFETNNNIFTSILYHFEEIFHIFDILLEIYLLKTEKIPGKSYIKKL